MTLLLLWWMLCCSYSNEKKSLLFFNEDETLIKWLPFYFEAVWVSEWTVTNIHHHHLNSLKKSYDCFRQICIISLWLLVKINKDYIIKPKYLPTFPFLFLYCMGKIPYTYACLCCTCHCEFGISFFSVSLIPSNKTETVISPFCFLFSPNFFHSFFWCIYVPGQ